MSNFTITCPHCGDPIELTETLARPLLESERDKAVAEAERRLSSERRAIEEAAEARARARDSVTIAALEQASSAKDAELARARTAELAAIKATEEAEDAKLSIELEVARRAMELSNAAAGRAREEASEEYAVELSSARREIAEKDAKLLEAQQAEIDARRAKREAEQAKREVELTVERRLDAVNIKAREQALKERDDEYRLKVLEKDRQLAELRQKLDEAQRKADQGPQQRAGDVLELDLCDTLQRAFPLDLFERVRKGQRGGDVVQTIRSSSGTVCGRILWESKRTKSWQEAWLSKLREDQREARAEIAALVTETLPEDLSALGERDGVWVTSLATVVPMAALLRHAIIETATARRASALTDSKKDLIFAYLTGPQFRQRMTSVAEAYVEMRADLDKEKRSAVKQWSSREQQLNRVVSSMAGVYGDLHGIVGASLPRVEGLSLHAPEVNEDDVGDGSAGREVA
jgi:hypothetical protein